MATETASASAVDDHAEDHPTETQYWIVFAALAVITALEVAWSYLGLSGPALVVPLIVMMLVKFVMVAGVFMHLYFDLDIRNGSYFTWAFAAGVAIALAVFMAVFATFEFQI